MDDEDDVLLLDEDNKEKKTWRHSRIGLFSFWSIVLFVLISYAQIYAMIGSLGLLLKQSQNIQF